MRSRMAAYLPALAVVLVGSVGGVDSAVAADAGLATLATPHGGMVQWTSGAQIDLGLVDHWYDIPALAVSFTSKKPALWRVSASTCARFSPVLRAEKAAIRVHLLVDGAEVDVTGAVYYNAGQTAQFSQLDQRLHLEALVSLDAGLHTIGVQAVKWWTAETSVVGVFADQNCWSSVTYSRIR